VLTPARFFSFPRWQSEWDYIAQLFGWTAFFLVNLLFFPVARGSPLLCLVKLPFEKAIRYHRWLAWWMLFFTLAHFVAYMTIWQKVGTVQKNVSSSTSLPRVFHTIMRPI
jgi:ferric-chelate reductase